MKRKKAGRKTTKKPPAVPAKPLRDLGGANPPRIPLPIVHWIEGEGLLPGSWTWKSRPRTEIEGVPLPPDLEKAVRFYAGQEFESLENSLTRPPWTYAPDGEDSEKNYPGWKEADISPNGWSWVRTTLEDCFRQGFYLALLRYADDLKQSVEAVPLLEGLREAARKGAAARKAQAAPIRKAVCKRFRELRKTTPKKTVRYLRIAEEFGMSERHVQRIVNDADLD
jgi:hypothetical protein